MIPHGLVTENTGTGRRGSMLDFVADVMMVRALTKMILFWAAAFRFHYPA